MKCEIQNFKVRNKAPKLCSEIFFVFVELLTGCQNILFVWSQFSSNIYHFAATIFPRAAHFYQSTSEWSVQVKKSRCVTKRRNRVQKFSVFFLSNYWKFVRMFFVSSQFSSNIYHFAATIIPRAVHFYQSTSEWSLKLKKSRRGRKRRNAFKFVCVRGFAQLLARWQNNCHPNFVCGFAELLAGWNNMFCVITLFVEHLVIISPRRSFREPLIFIRWNMLNLARFIARIPHVELMMFWMKSRLREVLMMFVAIDHDFNVWYAIDYGFYKIW